MTELGSNSNSEQHEHEHERELLHNDLVVEVMTSSTNKAVDNATTTTATTHLENSRATTPVFNKSTVVDVDSSECDPFEHMHSNSVNFTIPIEMLPMTYPDIAQTTGDDILHSPSLNSSSSSSSSTSSPSTSPPIHDGIQQQEESSSWFSSIQSSFRTFNNRIKQMFISPETEEALGEIETLFTKFFKDVPYSKFDMLTGLLLLDSYYKNAHIASGEHKEDKEFVRLASHYMRFAAASFGSKYVYSYYTKRNVIQGVTGTDSLNVQVLCEHTGIGKDDIICYRFTSTNFDPGHFVAIDHKTKSIILSIRGTFHARDILTDLVATNTKFLKGYAHNGILRCARNKFNELSSLLVQQLDEHPGYRLVPVGHSLGAGTAALFTLLFHAEYPDLPIHCYAFAPPCVTSFEMALDESTKRLITSFVLNDDMIPRLSYQSLEHLKTMVCSLLESNTNLIQKSFQILAAGNTLGEEMTNKIAGFLRVSREVNIVATKSILSESTMLPPGDIYRIYKMEQRDKHHVMERSNPALFGEIIISSTLLTDHFPDNYENALSSCLQMLNDITPENYLSEFVLMDNGDIVSDIKPPVLAGDTDDVSDYLSDDDDDDNDKEEHKDEQDDNNNNVNRISPAEESIPTTKTTTIINTIANGVQVVPASQPSPVSEPAPAPVPEPSQEQVVTEEAIEVWPTTMSS
ncbi:hypothetical protein SAMD00019534_057200 [Acytostelium subglobosum LB1]|uniref:hypothetical protein n=1 Tax=Acytostelium subglobosum LB1 TaxID=1410327 RepID=UPI0006448E01|nr:hypothetical protein SAMD00019534_057200 [Acytostelium subglobosum LB1]GAM22545.1 hypothetical protein SAMD00019534_057200 [Acytostelium subglobosum LB1]|eukprot:XP_012754665.1 hypothetical protein SAMD00019534_057200 [Acytostelium subglobosum LB1]